LFIVLKHLPSGLAFAPARLAGVHSSIVPGILSTVVCFSPLALAPLTAAEAVSHFATLDGVKIHYDSFGQGDEAVVFIHGWTCDRTFWKAQAPVYETRRSVLIDLPGHGLSDKPDIPYTMDLFARAVDAVLTDASVRRATLVGHSMGTPVAVQFLRLRPEKVAGLVFVDGFVPQPPKDDAEREKQKLQSAQRAKIYRAPDYKDAVTRMLDFMFTKQTDPALRRSIETRMLSAPQYVMASAMEGMSAMPPLTESYPRLPVGAVMVKRGNTTGYQKFLKEHFDLVGYREFDNAGHFLMMEQPDKFNAILLQFLDHK
jgi:pimeloyl-ACP methyl ester carboxylesterase